ncbi:DUF3822 family protein [Fibrivirga algicola]|uniref:DUF3822 family protein n=1 Tax=Fibrivirga algicola TaxID=2950420 RepID=A0ABX0QQL5_9BACT|nr:DUF3822 family protein [Fibrivirga algicola]ARK12401.1 hypothetical protein A6C57_19815 [Fibrella sp. ES10-3-2-2]NID12464.1 DUF3822 family protein [Fibrivirga algicola]
MVTLSTLSPTLSIRPEVLTPSQAATSVLCLELAAQRLRITLLDPQRRMVWLDEYAQPSLLTEQSLLTYLPAVFKDHPLLSYDEFQHVRVSVLSPAFTLIPSSLYRKEYASSYLALMRGHQPPPNELAHAYEHKEGFVSVFGIDRDVTEFMGEQYPMQPFTYVHQHTTLIQATRAVDRQLTTKENLFLYFEDEYVTVLFRDEHQLKYCNRFGYKNVQDLTYYVLYVLDELGVDPEAVHAFVYGESTPFAESYVALSRFVPTMSIGQLPPGLNPSPELEELPEHRYLGLQGLCLLG